MVHFNVDGHDRGLLLARAVAAFAQVWPDVCGALTLRLMREPNEVLAAANIGALTIRDNEQNLDLDHMIELMRDLADQLDQALRRLASSCDSQGEAI